MTLRKGWGRLVRPRTQRLGRQIMKTVVVALVLSVMGVSAALAGNCTYTTDRASDGSRCGDRASTVRPGGK